MVREGVGLELSYGLESTTASGSRIRDSIPLQSEHPQAQAGGQKLLAPFSKTTFGLRIAMRWAIIS